MKAPEGTTSEYIADEVCRKQGHCIVMFSESNKYMCTKCGLNLDEIRGGETKNRVTD